MSLIFNTSSRQDQFGFYQVGDLKFYSKLEAIAAEQKTGKALHWNFNDQVYSSFAWTEPTESLNELYQQRAQKLRDQYDYLILFYSGGADSDNILQTFICNNIKIDEVVSFVNYEATKDKFNFLNGEIYNVVGDRVSQAQQHQPDLYHRIIDLCKYTVDYFKISNSKFDWIYEMRSLYNPNAVVQQYIKNKIPEWNKLFDSGKKVAFIYGIDKPKVIHKNNQYFFTFKDVMDFAVSAKTQIENNPWEFNELFYWTPDSPLIPAKQAHVIKNFIDSHNPLTNQEFFDKVFDGWRYVFVDTGTETVALKPEIMHQLIYPYWTPTAFQFKAKSMLFTPRDSWFIKLPDSYIAKKSWNIGVEQLLYLFPDKYKNHTKKGLSYFESQMYELK
jgi:hypothetical protein